MRCGFLCIVLHRAGYWTLPLCAWALAVPWSRVALGKHFLFDVVVGLFLGLLLADLICSLNTSGLTRIGIATIFTLEAIAVLFNKKWRKELPGAGILLTIAVVFWVSFGYSQ